MTSDLLSNRELRRYKNQIEIVEIGISGQEKLIKAKVLVIGSGSIGTSVLQNLVPAGVGTIGIVDNAMVEETNIHRQSVYGTSDLGKQKAIITKQKLQELNAQVLLNVHNLCISFSNMEQISHEYDIIVDASNFNETNLAIWNYCAQYKKPLVYGLVNGFEIEIGVFVDSDKLYSQIDKNIEKIKVEGFLGAMGSFTGSIMSIEVIKLIVGMERTYENITKTFNLKSLL